MPDCFPRSFIGALLLLAPAAAEAERAVAQQAEGLPIAVVNVDRLLKAYKPLQDQLEPLKKEARELEETAQLRQAEFETVAAKLRNTQPGTPEFQRLQQQGVKLQNELRQFVQTERGGLQKREAQILSAFHERFQGVLSRYAKQHKIQLVLRQHDVPDEDEPTLQNVLGALNKRVLYQDDELDITDELLKILESEPATTAR